MLLMLLSTYQQLDNEKLIVKVFGRFPFLGETAEYYELLHYACRHSASERSTA